MATGLTPVRCGFFPSEGGGGFFTAAIFSFPV
jgi:hypothetical protein